MFHRLLMLKIFLVLTPRIFPSFSPIMQDPPHLKILLLGDVAVGKSSILRRYMNNSFSYDTRATIGVDFFTKKMRVHRQLYHAYLWDTSGLERFNSITSGYLRGANAIILVFSLTDRDSLLNLSHRWLKLIHESPYTQWRKSPILILGNKRDLEPDRRVGLADIQKLLMTGKYQYAEVSAKEGGDLAKIISEFLVSCALSSGNKAMRPIGVNLGYPAEPSEWDCCY